MKISVDEVRRVARLARLHLDEDDLVRHAHHLERILEHMETLNAVALPDDETEAVASGSALRADVVMPPEEGFDGLAQAPSRSDDFFVVPRIIEG